MKTTVAKLTELAQGLQTQATLAQGVFGYKWKPVHHKYKPLRLIGKGSSSEVILASQRDTSVQVAIKHIRVKSDSAQAVVREVTILRELSSMPHNKATVRMLDLLTDEDAEGRLSLFIVTEYFPLSLADIMNAPDTADLDEQDVTIISHGVIRALSFLHSANVIHRDLKPSNVLLTPDLDIRLCDFGLSRTMPDNAESVTDYLSPSFSSEGSEWQIGAGQEEEKNGGSMSSHVFTRFYRPPEVILLQRYGFTADIWSAGCIIYELLACSSRYKKNLLGEFQQRVLFRGAHCEPLSPRSSESSSGGQDQLDTILEVLGYQGDTHLEFYDMKAQKQIGKIQDHLMAPPLDLPHLFFYTSLELLDLLEQMLSFSPDMRGTASQLLDHDVWGTISSDDAKVPCKIRIATDQVAKAALKDWEWVRVLQKEIKHFLEARE